MDARKAPAGSAAKMVEGNGAATGQAVADRGSKQASEIGKQADSSKRSNGGGGDVRERNLEGKEFEVKAGEALDKSGYTEARDQLRVRTDSGKLRVVDRNATAPNGEKVNIEMTALTKRATRRHNGTRTRRSPKPVGPLRVGARTKAKDSLRRQLRLSGRAT